MASDLAEAAELADPAVKPKARLASGKFGVLWLRGLPHFSAPDPGISRVFLHCIECTRKAISDTAYLV